MSYDHNILGIAKQVLDAKLQHHNSSEITEDPTNLSVLLQPQEPKRKNK